MEHILVVAVLAGLATSFIFIVRAIFWPRRAASAKIAAASFAVALASALTLGFWVAPKATETVRSAVARPVGKPEKAQPVARCGGSPGAASSFAKRVVRESLKAPDSAKFSSVQGHRDKGCAFVVAGRVSAQNSFGAHLAHNFSVRIIFDPEDPIRWTFDGLSVTPL